MFFYESMLLCLIFAYCMETERCKSLENIIFYLGRKEKKETLTEGINTEDERSLGLSASLDNVLRRRLENYNLGIEETEGDDYCFLEQFPVWYMHLMSTIYMYALKQ